ncbi:MAG: hypothetical protein ACWA41_03790 [Putridiphycobacter sp.]
MKSFITIWLFLSLTSAVFGQNQFSQITFTGGGTYNFLREVYKIPFKGYEKSFKFTVGQQFNIDAALLRRFSVGGGFTHQKQALTIQNYQFYDGPAIVTETPTLTTHVYSAYFRLLIHILETYKNTNEKFDLYWGVGPNFTVITATNNSLDPNFYRPPSGFIPFFNGVGGVRFYPTEQFGFYIEGSFPVAYTIAAGVTYRTEGRDRFFKKKYILF